MIKVDNRKKTDVDSPTSDVIDTEMHEVKMRVFSDPDLYDEEMRKVFGKAWLLIAHESEIPAKGDFVTRDMGGDKVIVARGRNGEIHVSLNVCPHRGMRVCMTEEGNAPTFRCIYHGWAFRHDGSFMGAPIPKEKMEGDMRDKSELGLQQAKVAIYGGFVFACWDHESSFDDWLGEYKFYTDALFERTINGMELLGPPQKAMIQANWKTAGEQFAGDGYHTLTLHRSLMDLGRIGGSNKDTGEAEKVSPGMYAVEISANGHGMRMIPPYRTLRALIGTKKEGLTPMEQLAEFPPPGITQEMLPELEKRLSPEQLWLLAEHGPAVGGMFPNVGFLWFYHQQVDGTVTPRMGLHTFLPRGPDKFEFWTWILAEKDTPEEVKQQMMEASVQSLGNTGMTEMDDAETWPHMQEAAKGPIGSEQTIKYQAIAGESRPDDWPEAAGGHVYNGFTKDDNQWNWWMRWKEMMDS